MLIIIEVKKSCRHSNCEFFFFSNFWIILNHIKISTSNLWQFDLPINGMTNQKKRAIKNKSLEPHI